MKIRSKLMAATAMLLVSAIMMTTASFAWFTISTNPEVSTMTSGVTVNQNLEIALAKAGTPKDADDLTQGYNMPKSPVATGDAQNRNYYTWGNLIDLSAADLDNQLEGNQKTNNVDAEIDKVDLRPMALTTVYKKNDQGVETDEVSTRKFTAPKYGNDGRISDEDGLTLTESGTYSVGTLKDEEDNAYGYYVDLWVRTNMADHYLGLTDAEERSTGGAQGSGSTVTSTNETFKENVTIAARILATATADDAVPTAAEATELINLQAGNTAGAMTSSNLLGKQLVKDTAYLIRVYVFLDGKTVTNAVANETGIEANVTLQFALYTYDDTTKTYTKATLESMDVSGTIEDLDEVTEPVTP